MSWTPPNSPPEGIATPEQVLGVTNELGGAAYRTQKHAWVPQQDSQIPYYEGFTRSKDAYGQPGINATHAEVGMNGPTPPPDVAPAGSQRPRDSKSPADIGGTSHRTNVQGGRETSGEAPAPLFNQAIGRTR